MDISPFDSPREFRESSTAPEERSAADVSPKSKAASCRRTPKKNTHGHEPGWKGGSRRHERSSREATGFEGIPVFSSPAGRAQPPKGANCSAGFGFDYFLSDALSKTWAGIGTSKATDSILNSVPPPVLRASLKTACVWTQRPPRRSTERTSRVFSSRPLLA